MIKNGDCTLKVYLQKLGIINDAFCRFREAEEETLSHLLMNCDVIYR